MSQIISKQYIVRGLTCTGCIKLITNRLENIDGVISATINDLAGQTNIESSKPLTLIQLQEALPGTNYLISEA